MKRTELDRIFTLKIAQYMAQGYLLNTETMGGTQGEIAKVDLTNGKELLRVLLEERHDFSDGLDLIVIKVGRCIDPPSSVTGTIWNDKLDLIEEMRWCKISEMWLVSVEEGRDAIRKRCARDGNRNTARGCELLSEAASVIVLPFVRRQDKCRGATAKDICVKKWISPDGRETRYYVKVKGRTFQMA